MKRNLIFPILSMTLVLAACQKAPAENQDGTSPPTAPGPYRQLYSQAVEEMPGDGTVFSLIYLNGDDIPELVVEGQGTYSIYTLKDNTIFCLADTLCTVELSYFEKTGVIAKFARWNGGGDEGGSSHYYYQVSPDSTLTEDTVPVLSYSYDAIYNEDGTYSGEGATLYYHMGQEIEETAYQEKLSQLGIAGGAGTACLENALGKEELKNLLRSGA